jgi:hypothetical protein
MWIFHCGASSLGVRISAAVGSVTSSRTQHNSSCTNLKFFAYLQLSMLEGLKKRMIWREMHKQSGRVGSP